jgi:hypothetical protein
VSLSVPEYLKAIIKYPAYREAFRSFLKSEFSDGNLDFYLAVEAYKQNPSKTKAIAIIDKFVGDQTRGVGTGIPLQGSGATKDANIGSAQRTDLRQVRDQYIANQETAAKMNFFHRHWTASRRVATKDVFDAAQEQVLKLMGRDTFQRFQLTPAGEAIIEAIDRAVAKDKRVVELLQNLGHL